MAPSKTQRWLDLLSLLVGRRFPIPIDEIMEQVLAYRDRWERGDDTSRATVRRMFERDKDELRRMGIPLETKRYRVEGLAEAEGYQILRRDFYLPYLELISSGTEEEEQGEGRPKSSPGPPHRIGRVRLEEDDARTAILALREVLSFPAFPFQREARSVLRKLTFDLDPALPEPAEGTHDLQPALRILDRPGGADPQEALGVLLDALYDRRRVRFRYHSIGRNVREDREVEPWGLLFQWGAWYLAARDPAKKGEDPQVRLFRADRMAKARPSRPGPTGPDFEVPAEFDIQVYARRKPWELRDDKDSELEVVLRFFPPTSLLADRNGWGELVEDGEDGETLRKFRVSRLGPFLRWVLGLAGEAEIVAPPEAVHQLTRMAEEVLEVYEGSAHEPT